MSCTSHNGGGVSIDISDIEALASSLQKGGNNEEELEEQSHRVEDQIQQEPEGDEHQIWLLELHKAIIRTDSGTIGNMLNFPPDGIINGINVTKPEYGGKSIFESAMSRGVETSLLLQMIELIPPEELTSVDNSNGATALHYAVLSHNLPAAKALVSKNRKIVHIRAKNGSLPVQLAGTRKQRKLVLYLHQHTQLNNQFTEEYSYDIFFQALQRGWFDFALHVIKKTQDFPWPQKPGLPLFYLQDQPEAFLSGTSLNKFQSVIYSCIPVNITEVMNRLENKEMVKAMERFRPDDVLGRRAFVHNKKALRVPLDMLNVIANKIWGILVKPIVDIRQKKIQHHLALEVLRVVCKKMKQAGVDASSLSMRFLNAAAMGNHEILEEILKEYPEVISSQDSDTGLAALHIGVMNRQEKVVKLALKYHRKELKLKNISEEGVLFQAAYCGHQNFIYSGSGVVFQMQRELRWFKEFVKLVPEQRGEMNSKLKTPITIFTEKHAEMVEYENKWMLEMANSCIIGGSLIAAVVFAAAITVPGGNNSDNGLPIYFNRTAFDIFSISNRLALVFSITSVIIFLSIFTARHSINDFIYSLPSRIIFGLLFLYLSFTSLMIDFAAISYLVSDKTKQDENLIITAALACIPIGFFTYLQLPSSINMIKSTYFHGSLTDDMDEKKKLDSEIE